MYDLVVSRCFGWGLPCTMMVPFADFMNHSNVDVHMDPIASKESKIQDAEDVDLTDLTGGEHTPHEEEEKKERLRDFSVKFDALTDANMWEIEYSESSQETDDEEEEDEED